MVWVLDLFAYLWAHQEALFGFLFVLSEAIGMSPWFKSSSVFQLLFGWIRKRANPQRSLHMSDVVIEQGPIGQVGSQSIVISGGKIIAKGQAQFVEGALTAKAEIDVEVDAKLLLEALILKLPANLQPIARVILAAIEQYVLQ